MSNSSASFTPTRTVHGSPGDDKHLRKKKNLWAPIPGRLDWKITARTWKGLSAILSIKD